VQRLRNVRRGLVMLDHRRKRLIAAWYSPRFR
jgi:hypothetical protein